jgi:hypothetical protein
MLCLSSTKNTLLSKVSAGKRAAWNSRFVAQIFHGFTQTQRAGSENGLEEGVYELGS